MDECGVVTTTDAAVIVSVLDWVMLVVEYDDAVVMEESVAV